ncbi:MAG: hypothetical protein QF681_12335, partial [Vicinamibacterales bacterium]|nr:hypothetical protein [Vicinamibacterales bacterium]
MPESHERSLAHNLYRNLLILCVLTVVFLLVLMLAPLKWRNTEWRELQQEYNALATANGVQP